MTTTNDTYTFVESATSDEWHIKIKEGAYKDIVYKYGKIQIKEVGEEAKLNFQYKVVDLPEDFDEEDLNHDVEFMTQLGDILTHIIEDSLESGKFKLGNNDKPNNSESAVHE
jgi:hypothetical protein